MAERKRGYHNYVQRIQELYNAGTIQGPEEIAEVRHETGCLSQLPKNPGICHCDVQIILVERRCPHCKRIIPRPTEDPNG